MADNITKRALLITLRDELEARSYILPQHLQGIADRCDPYLASLMRKAADAQRKLDAYIIAQTSPATRSK